MPLINEINTAREVGLSQSRRRVVWAACLDCGIERWVWLRSGQPQSLRCFPCGRRQGGKTFKSRYFGARTSGWKGGRWVNQEGYIKVTLAPDDPFIAMSRHGRSNDVLEHRIVMARHLGRTLESSEAVHHRNKDKQDNRIDNLELIDHSNHASNHQTMEELYRENQALKQENERLKGLLNG